MKIPNSFPDTRTAHIPFFTPKDFLTPTYFWQKFVLPQVVFHFHGIIPRTPPKTTNKQDTCTDIYLYRFMYRYITVHKLCRWALLLCTLLQTVHCTLYTIHCCTTWHLWSTHYAWISCTDVSLYCSPVSVHLCCKLVLTNESPSRITFMNRVHQSQIRF